METENVHLDENWSSVQSFVGKSNVIFTLSQSIKFGFHALNKVIFTTIFLLRKNGGLLGACRQMCNKKHIDCGAFFIKVNLDTPQRCTLQLDLPIKHESYAFFQNVFVH